MKTAALCAAVLAVLATQATAQSVALSGMLGGKALVMVDGAPPKTVATGDTYKGVKIIFTGRYEDDLKRVNGQWQFARRKLHQDKPPTAAA